MLPRRALTDGDLRKYAKLMRIQYFRGTFMRNDLPKKGPWKNESAIINLDDKQGPGTHWVAYKKLGNDVTYFDSFGNLQPPTDLFNYLRVGSIKHNYIRYQDWNTFNCGHLCLMFLTGQL